MRVLMALMLILAASSAAAQQDARFSSPPFTLLPGCWRSAGGGEFTDEIWSTAEGGLMIGAGRTVREGWAVWFEHLRIEQEGDSILYVSRPVGQKEAAFLLAGGDAASLEFANPLHDFPRRITYRFPAPDSLDVEISGPGRDGERVSRFSFRRRTCP